MIIKNKPEQLGKEVIISFLPAALIQLISQTVSFITYNLGLPLPLFNMKPHQFGSVLFTNVTSMEGFHEVYAPMTNFSRAVASVVLCAPKERVVVENGEIKKAKMMNMMVTFDHRYLDGAGATKMFAPIYDVWNNPAKYF